MCHSSFTEVTEVPGKGIGFLQNLQDFWVRVRKCFRTRSSSGYCGTGVQNSQKFAVGMKMLYPYPGHCGTGVYNSEFPGTGMNVIQNLQKFRVRVRKCYPEYGL